jgi:predicted dehydrogenase
MTNGTDKLGVVVVGTSFGAITHVPALRNAGFDVVAIVGTDPERTARRAGMLGIPHAGTSLTEALELPSVSAVSVASPPHTHRDLVLEAVGAGKHVICEKPFAANAREAEEMCAAAERAGVVNLVGHELRWLPALALVERLVKEGAIGEPRLATIIYLAPALAGSEDNAPAWWTDAASGGGWLGAQGTHMFDNIEATLGPIQAVSGGLTVASDHDWSADDSYSVHFRTQGGIDGIVQSSYATYGPLTALTRISGTHGTVWTEGNTVSTEARIFLADASGQREVTIPAELRWEMPPPLPAEFIADLDTPYARYHARGTTIPLYSRMAGAFRDLILGRPVPEHPAPPTFAAGLAHMRVADAVRRAASGEGWVEVDRGPAAAVVGAEASAG